MHRTVLRFGFPFLVAVAALAAPPPAESQPRRSEILRERLKARPGDPTLHYYLSLAAFAEGDTAGGLAALERVARLGRGFLPARHLGFERVWSLPAFQATYRRLERALPRRTAAVELFRLDRRLIPEGIAYDPVTGSYFVGSIALRKIVRVDAAGAASDFSRPGELEEVLGLAVDAATRRLHAVSTRIDPPDSGRVNRVVSYDLDGGGLVRSVDVAAAVQLNDVALAPGGELFVSDSQAGAVYRIDAGGAVDTVVAPRGLPGANGLAWFAAGPALYVAHSTGVARVEPASGDVLPRIALPDGETVGAIDGLYADGGALIGIQNVTNPGRVIRIALAGDGRSARRVETLLSHHHPAIDEPTTGVVVGRAFALLATTQVARYRPDGTIESPETLRPPIVLRVPLPAR